YSLARLRATPWLRLVTADQARLTRRRGGGGLGLGRLMLIVFLLVLLLLLALGVLGLLRGIVRVGALIGLGHLVALLDVVLLLVGLGASVVHVFFVVIAGGLGLAADRCRCGGRGDDLAEHACGGAVRAAGARRRWSLRHDE